MKKDWSNYRFVVLLPFLFVAIVYATEAFTRGSFFSCSNKRFCKDPIPEHIGKVLKFVPDTTGSVENDAAREVIALKYSGRMTWYMLGEIFFYISVGSLMIAAVLAFQMFPHPRIVWTLLLFVLASIVGLFFYALPEIHMAVFLTLFKNAITGDVSAISQITNFLNSLANAALFTLLTSICATLLPMQADSFTAGMKQLSTRMKSLSIILYAGTCLLVASMLLKKAIFQWSFAYTQDPTDEIAGNFVASLLTMDGAFYTLVMAAAYFPAALVLQRRTQLLVDSSVDEAEREVKFKEYGMNFSLKESLPRILAVMGPFLTGPVGDLLTGNFF